MAAKMAVGGLRWRSRLWVAVSVPVLGVPFFQTVKAGSIKVHPRELEVYDEPVEALQGKPNEEVTGLEEKVSVARRFVWGWTSKVKEGIAKTRKMFSSAEERSLEFVELIRTDRQLMKVGGITAAVFGGALLAGRGRRPIRRIFFSSVLGTTAAAICYPKQAVHITQTNYQRLKAFINDQRNKYNQKQAEKAIKEELKNSVDETKMLEGQEAAAVDEVKEDDAAGKNEVGQEQEKQETTTQPVITSEDKPQGSFWSKIPFVDKFIGGKSSKAGDVSPVQVSESVDESESSKDQVIVQEESSSEVSKPEEDIGQSNPEDKDMYSTRS